MATETELQDQLTNLVSIFPGGTPVIFWPKKREGDGQPGVTVGEPYISADKIVVKVKDNGDESEKILRMDHVEKAIKSEETQDNPLERLSDEEKREIADVAAQMYNTEKDIVAAESAIEDLKEKTKVKREELEGHNAKLRSLSQAIVEIVDGWELHPLFQKPEGETSDKPEEKKTSGESEEDDQEKLESTPAKPGTMAAPIEDMLIDREIPKFGDARKLAFVEQYPTVAAFSKAYADLEGDAPPEGDINIKPIMPNGFPAATCDAIRDAYIAWFDQDSAAANKDVSEPESKDNADDQEETKEPDSTEESVEKPDYDFDDDLSDL